MSPNTLRVIAYTFALWTLTSIITGLILWKLTDKPCTPMFPWERKP